MRVADSLFYDFYTSTLASEINVCLSTLGLALLLIQVISPQCLQHCRSLLSLRFLLNTFHSLQFKLYRQWVISIQFTSSTNHGPWASVLPQYTNTHIVTLLIALAPVLKRMKLLVRRRSMKSYNCPTVTSMTNTGALSSVTAIVDVETMSS